MIYRQLRMRKTEGGPIVAEKIVVVAEKTVVLVKQRAVAAIVGRMIGRW
jgi:ribose 5-phosphate isomerase